MPLLAAAVAVFWASIGAQVGRIWTFDDLTAKADLVVIASHISTQDTARRRMHPELKPGVRVAELQTDLKVLQVLKADAGAALAVGATLSLRHYIVIEQGFVNTGSALRFPEAARAYLLFLTRQPDGMYEPVSGHTFPTDSVYLLDRVDRFALPLPPSLPNMSGTWTLVNAADAPSNAVRELRVTQDAKTFAVGAAAGTLPAPTTYVLGIIGGIVSTDGSRRQWSAAQRDESLVIETSTSSAAAGSGQEAWWRSEVWSVAGDRLTIQIKERQGSGTVLETTLVYRRSGTRHE